MCIKFTGPAGYYSGLLVLIIPYQKKLGSRICFFEGAPCIIDPPSAPAIDWDVLLARVNRLMVHVCIKLGTIGINNTVSK